MQAKVSKTLWISLLTSGLFFGSCASQQNISYDQLLLQTKQEAKQKLARQIDEFNQYPNRPESDGPLNGSNNKAFLLENIPYFNSSNDTLAKVYNYRWWMISKHLRDYADPIDHRNYWVFTEFFGTPAWASLSGAITCPAGHQFYDVRWLRDPKYLASYAEYFMAGSASKLDQRENGNFLTYLSRPESVHFSSWMVDGVAAFQKVHPDHAWQAKMLPHLEHHQHILDSLFTVKNPQAKTNGLYKILDLYDGMEFSLSAVLGLIASDGPYSIYTDKTWRDLYLGWGTTDNAAKSPEASQYPKAFRKGYPDYYLARPSVNSYAFGNFTAIADLYQLQDQLAPSANNKQKVKEYQTKAKNLQNKVLSVLWNPEMQFFNTYSAGDNEFGKGDYEAPVRESVGYSPWYFNMIPKEDQATYAKAWDMFSSEKGFHNHMGMTTAERQHPYYNEQAYAWNGRGWPFQNSVVYKAYANYLKNYKKEITDQDRDLLYQNIMQLANLHTYKQPNIGEWYIPSNGQEIGGQQDYFHSTFPDMIIEDLIGFTASHEDYLEIQSLIPAHAMDSFYLGNLVYHGKEIDIVWKKDLDKTKAGNQGKLLVWVNGKLKASSANLNEKLKVKLK